MTEMRVIPGSGGRYFATADGQIISTARAGERVLRGGLDKDGYRKFIMCVDGVRRNVRVHVMVAHAFHGEQPAGTVVCHLDGDSANNRPSNLAYVTQHENVGHKRTHGTLLFGEKHPSALITEIEARDIIKSSMSYRDLARRYGLSRSGVMCIKKGRTWGWLRDAMKREIEALDREGLA